MGSADRRRDRPDHRTRQPDRDDAAAARCRPGPRSHVSKLVVRSRAAFIYTHARARRSSSTSLTSKTSRRASSTRESATISDANKITDLTRTGCGGRRASARCAELRVTGRSQQRDTLLTMKNSLETVTLGQKKLLDEAGTITVMGDSELTGDQIAVLVRGAGRPLPVERRYDHRRAGRPLRRGRRRRTRSRRHRVRAGDPRDRLVRARDRQQLRRHRRVRQLQRGDPVPHAARRRPRPDPDAEELRRSRRRARPTSPTRRRHRSTGRTRLRPPQAYDTFFAKGRVPTWNLMGNGNWATAAEYAPKVLGLYFEMVAVRCAQGLMANAG